MIDQLHLVLQSRDFQLIARLFTRDTHHQQHHVRQLNTLANVAAFLKQNPLISALCIMLTALQKSID